MNNRWNNGFEVKTFEKRCSSLKKRYRKLGMRPIDIQTIMKQDKEEFLSDRRFIEHNVASYDHETEVWEKGAETEQGSVCTRFQERFSTEDNLPDWREEIESESLYKAIESLTPMQLKVLHMSVFCGMTADAIGEKMGVSRSAISNRLSRIKKKIKKLN